MFINITSCNSTGISENPWSMYVLITVTTWSMYVLIKVTTCVKYADVFEKSILVGFNRQIKSVNAASEDANMHGSSRAHFSLHVHQTTLVLMVYFQDWRLQWVTVPKVTSALLVPLSRTLVVSHMETSVQQALTVPRALNPPPLVQWDRICPTPPEYPSLIVCRALEENTALHQDKLHLQVAIYLSTSLSKFKGKKIIIKCLTTNWYFSVPVSVIMAYPICPNFQCRTSTWSYYREESAIA